MRKLCFLFAFAIVANLMAQPLWEKKPYTEWSAIEVDRVLNGAPWVALHSAGSSSRGVPTSLSLPGGKQQKFTTFYVYCLRLLTAKPIGEALLRLIALGGMPGTAVALKDLNTGTEAERERLNAFMKSRPDDVRVRGDADYIIVAITLRVGTGASTFEPLPKHWVEILMPADRESNPSEFDRKTSLSTDKGDRVSLARYEPHDQLGAKYYFPRARTDGRPLITSGSKELRFETMIQRTRIKVKFDLSKMVYKGKIET
jgi:hypothetical protein